MFELEMILRLDELWSHTSFSHIHLEIVLTVNMVGHMAQLLVCYSLCTR